ncbi:hypothetical protein I5E68_09710 [Novosphingobium sp. YJ-S2-02]|uniref:Uncharacterized protein n=1 Tax=Novosphingobium aureum TaxID=2792964 RepID=A0A931HC40_9SPHN|nr:hypothetical protein [Novosphingobium aureum]MBH0113221.1 hypothetical protein [Novosphingobium aureum]
MTLRSGRYQVGTRLYVREPYSEPQPLAVTAIGPHPGDPWRRFSRLWLEVTEVRVQRLHEISHEDCIKEGYPILPDPVSGRETMLAGAREWFADLWDRFETTSGERWQANPWVFALSFNVHRGNIDEAAA